MDYNFFFSSEDAVIFADNGTRSTPRVSPLQEALHEEIKPLEHWNSRPKTIVQVIRGLLHGTGQPVHVCGEDIKISEISTYHSSVVHNAGGLSQEFERWIGLAFGVM